jgi:PAS domain-containing protein
LLDDFRVSEKRFCTERHPDRQSQYDPRPQRRRQLPSPDMHDLEYEGSRAFGDGLMSYEDFTARLLEVEAEAEEAKRIVNEISNRGKRIQELKQQRAKMQQILEAIPDYLELAPREEVNRVLREFIEVITISPNGKVIRLKLQ